MNTNVLRKWVIGIVYITWFVLSNLLVDAEFTSMLTDVGKIWLKILMNVAAGTRMYLDISPGRSNDAAFREGDSNAELNPAPEPLPLREDGPIDPKFVK